MYIYIYVWVCVWVLLCYCAIVRVCVFVFELENETFLQFQWNTKSSRFPTFSILPKLHEHWESCGRNAFEFQEFWTVENHVIVNKLLCFSHFTEVH